MPIPYREISHSSPIRGLTPPARLFLSSTFYLLPSTSIMPQTLTRAIDAVYRDKFPASAKLYERGKSLFPDGVTHDGRFLKPFPVYIEHALGSKKYDADGNEIIDYWMGHGSLLLGHSHPAVVD